PRKVDMSSITRMSASSSGVIPRYRRSFFISEFSILQLLKNLITEPPPLSTQPLFAAHLEEQFGDTYAQCQGALLRWGPKNGNPGGEAMMTEQTMNPTFNARNYDVFAGLDVDKRSLTVTFTDWRQSIKSVHMSYSAEHLLRYVDRQFPKQRIAFVYEAG